MRWQGLDPRQGLPKIREEWVARREERGDKVHPESGLPCSCMSCTTHPAT